MAVLQDVSKANGKSKATADPYGSAGSPEG